MFDLLIKNGLVVDGRGGEGEIADLAIRGEKISEIGNLPPGTAQRVIDATGRVVSPGFIDIHGHSDFKLLLDRKAKSRVSQGVTTEVGGNCGLSGAPLPGEMKRRLEEAYRKYDLCLDWSTFEEYVKRLGEGLGINFVPLIGQNNIRASLMGEESHPASAKEIKKMKNLIVSTLEKGAFGLSTGLIYPPGCFATEDELIELCEVVGRKGGLYSTHIRGEGKHLLEAIEEAITVARRAGVKVQISHLKAAGESNWPKLKKAIQMITDAREEGLEITADRYPYTASCTDLDSILPLWVQEGGRRKELERLKDPELRKRISRGIEKDYPSLEKWHDIMLSAVSRQKQLEGKRMGEIIVQRKQSPSQVLFDLLLEEETEVTAIFFSMSEDNLREVLTQPFSMVGSDSSLYLNHPSEGRPHPRTLGTFPRFLRRFVREDKILKLGEAVSKMTCQPAKTLGLRRRGQIREGYYADLTIFNLSTITDRATYEDPFSYAAGIDYTIVNAEIVFEKGKCTGKLPGKVLRRGQD